MPSPASSDNNKYNDVCNLSLVHTQLTAVLEEPQLSIPSYILAYHEFHKFFTSLGAIFGFVASDVKEKIEIMEMFQAGANSTHFKTDPGRSCACTELCVRPLPLSKHKNY